jgi:hypothetical protein
LTATNKRNNSIVSGRIATEETGVIEKESYRENRDDPYDDSSDSLEEDPFESRQRRRTRRTRLFVLQRDVDVELCVVLGTGYTG